MVLVIDIEEELKKVQVKHIQKGLEQLRLYYDEHTDLKFLQILCSYEEMLELATTTDERLLLYKKMYQDSLDYLFQEVQSSQSDDGDIDDSKENGELPF